MSASAPDLPVILARASSRSREALNSARDEADAWLETLWSGPLSTGQLCVISGSTGPLELHHIAGKRHGNLVVSVSSALHRLLSEQQMEWDPLWKRPKRSPRLDRSLLIRGSIDLLELRAQFVPRSRAGAYLTLAASLREQYDQLTDRTE